MRKINTKDINDIVGEIAKHQFQIKMADIAFVLLSEMFEEINIPYAILFGKGATITEIKKYGNSRRIKMLKSYMDKNYPLSGASTSGGYADISFQENKSEMIKLIDELKQKYDDGKLAYKDYAKMVTDLRTKLNDKFQVSDDETQQYVVVNTKYNDICVCGREIYRPTKEDIMRELSKEYELIPKGDGQQYERED